MDRISVKVSLSIRVAYNLILLLICLSCKNENLKKNDKLKANELINESSPYLLQHAYNPVDWKSWSKVTLDQAKEQNKLIVVSIGYASCHWCHVMEHESFENDSIAEFMNQNFINIKVDREERPDVDQLYMNAVQLMTGGGGWPLNCITLPDGRPVYGGTYYTPEEWIQVIKNISDLYNKEPEKVIAFADNLESGIKNSDLIKVNSEQVEFATNNLELIVNNIKESLDFNDGGQKSVPKFPLPSHLNFLLRYAHHYDDIEVKNYVDNTLEKIAFGGIYDQIGGGFSRYTIDKDWHIPHFEKMLYDNAQLINVYSKAYITTKKPLYRNAVENSINFLTSELKSGIGVFFSSLDADSKGIDGKYREGAFYGWSKAELKNILNDDFRLFSQYYNINEYGFWEDDTYILIRTTDKQSFAKQFNLDLDVLTTKIDEWKSKLLVARGKRERPRVDDKILTSWNALTISALCQAYKALNDDRYLKGAKEIAEFIDKNLISNTGEIKRSYKLGKSSISGFAEDYAQIIQSFIDLYMVTLNKYWLERSKQLMDYTIKNFLNKENGMFYFTSKASSDLMTRKTEVFDNVIPSSNSVLAKNLFVLGHYYYNQEYLKMSSQMLSNLIADIEASPLSYTNWLDLYLDHSNPFYEIAVSGDLALEKIRTINANYLPNVAIAGARRDDDLPILVNKYNSEETYIYVCVNGTCKLPVTDVDKALNQIKKR